MYRYTIPYEVQNRTGKVIDKDSIDVVADCELEALNIYMDKAPMSWYQRGVILRDGKPIRYNVIHDLNGRESVIRHNISEYDANEVCGYIDNTYMVECFDKN